MLLNIPNVDDLFLGNIIVSHVGQWNVPLKQRSDPCFLMSLVFYVFAEPLRALLPRHCKDAQSPWIGLLWAGAPPSPAHGLIAEARLLVQSRDRREEPDRRPCADSRRQSRRQSIRGAHDWRRGRRRWRLSVRVLVWLLGWMLRKRLGGGGLVLKTTLKTSVVPSRFCKSATLLVTLVAWTHRREMWHNSVSRASESISIIWVPILCIVWSQYQTFNRAWHSILYCRGLACFSISYHALTVCQAWHSFLYLFTPWQYLPRLGILFNILSRLGSICPGLAFYSISDPGLAVSAQAWHAILYLNLSFVFIYEFIIHIWEYELIYKFMSWIHTQTLLGSSWYPRIHMFFSWIYIWIHDFPWIHIWIHDFPWIHIWIEGMNSDSCYPWVHGFS